MFEQNQFNKLKREIKLSHNQLNGMIESVKLVSANLNTNIGIVSNLQKDYSDIKQNILS